MCPLSKSTGSSKSGQIEQFFKQNVFNEKLNITKNPFTWHLREPCRVQLFDISSNLNDGFYSCQAFARCNAVLSMPTNVASIVVFMSH